MRKKIITLGFCSLLFHFGFAQSISAFEDVTPQAQNSPRSLPEPKNGSEDTYVVKQGDNLYRISVNHKTTVDEIKALNGLSSNALNIGQVLKMPTNAARTTPTLNSIATTPSKPAKDSKIYHTVKEGESFFDIADNYGVSMDDIRNWNGITVLNPGEKIIVGRENSREIPPLDASFDPTISVSVEAPNTPSAPEVTPVSTPALASNPTAKLPEATAPKVSKGTEIVAPFVPTGSKIENGSYIIVEDLTQKSPYYVYHKTLPKGTKVYLHIPNNAGYVEATVVNKIRADRKEVIGLSPACARLNGGLKATPIVTVSYNP